MTKQTKQSNERKLKKGDVVQFEYRDKYDRETGTGVIVEVENNPFLMYKVALVKREKGEWFWTNYWCWKTANRVEPLSKIVKDLGLEI